MELTPLQPTAQTQLPMLTQVESLALTQTDESAEVKTAAVDSSPATNGSGLEPIQEANTDERNDETNSGCESASAAKVEEPEATLSGSEPI